MTVYRIQVKEKDGSWATTLGSYPTMTEAEIACQEAQAYLNVTTRVIEEVI